MSSSKNRWTLIGNLAADPEAGRGATTVARIRIAVESYNPTTKTREAEFFPVVAFGKQAEFALKYLKKGSGAVIEGRMGMNKWTDKAGQNRNEVQLKADSIEFGPSSKGAYGTPHVPAPGATVFDEDGEEEPSLF